MDASVVFVIWEYRHVSVGVEAISLFSSQNNVANLFYVFRAEFALCVFFNSLIVLFLTIVFLCFVNFYFA